MTASEPAMTFHRHADPRIVAKPTQALGRPHGGRCLDLACDGGNYTAALARQGDLK